MPHKNEKGLVVLETLALYENEDIREKATEILEDQLDYNLEFAYENLIGATLEEINVHENQQEEMQSQGILQMISTGQIQPNSSADPSQQAHTYCINN